MNSYTVERGTFEEENICKLVKNTFFTEKTFCGLLTCSVPNNSMPPDFVEKTLANSHKTTKFAKVFSLESFPLYSIVLLYW